MISREDAVAGIRVLGLSELADSLGRSGFDAFTVEDVDPAVMESTYRRRAGRSSAGWSVREAAESIVTALTRRHRESLVMVQVRAGDGATGMFLFDGGDGTPVCVLPDKPIG